MSEDKTLLQQLQRQNAGIQRLLTPNLKPTTGSEPFAGRKFQVAARQMRTMHPERLNLARQSDKASLGSEISQRFQSSAQGLHINPKAVQRSKSWDTVERVFHGPAAASKRETPAAAGELRQGSIIPRMETFPKPGQSVDEFRQQFQAAPRPKQEAAPKKVVVAPKARIFTRVEEISKPSVKPSAPSSKDEPDPAPISAMRAPPTEPAAPPSVQRQIDSAETPSLPAIEKGLASFVSASPTSTPVSLPNSNPAPNAPITVSRKPESAIQRQPEQGVPSASEPAPAIEPVSAKIPALPVVNRQQAENAEELDTPVQRKTTVSRQAPNVQAKAVQRQPATKLPLAKPTQSQRTESVKVNRSVTSDVKRTAESPAASTPQPPAAKPIVQTKPATQVVQRNVTNEQEEMPVARAVSASNTEEISATTQQSLSTNQPTDANTELLQAKPVQRKSVEPAQLEELNEGPKLQAKLVQRQSLEPVQPEILDEGPKLQAKSIQRQSAEPVQPEGFDEETKLQTKLVQRQSVEPVQPEALDEGLKLQAKLIQAKPQVVQPKLQPELPLARKILAPKGLTSVQSARPVLSTGKASSIQRLEGKGLAPSSSPDSQTTSQVSIARLPGQSNVNVVASRSPLVLRMPLQQKVQSQARIENSVQMMRSEKLQLKNSPATVLQLQRAELVHPEKYKAASVPLGLAGMTATASDQTSPSGSAPMPLARMAQSDGAVSPQTQASMSVQRSISAGQPISTSNGGGSAVSFEGEGTNQQQPDEPGKDGKKPVDLNALAEEIFPIVKRLLAIEADRSGDGFR